MLFKHLKKTLIASTALVAAASVSAQAADEVEVLHWWTSGGEAAALNVLKGNLENENVSWADMPVAGGAGAAAMTVLRARVTTGNPPTAAQLLGFDIQDWAGEGLLGNLNEVAEQEGWDDVIPAALQRFAKHDGVWVGAPVNIHSTNWVWANKAVLDEAGVEQPTTWEEFVDSLEKIKAAGKIPFALGGQDWQEATMFDSLVIGAGGLDFYKKAFIDLDEEALTSDTMKEAFSRLATLRSYVDDNFSGRDWNLTTAMVINGEAAYQIMGDWAKGEFLGADKTPGEDFLCFRVPGTEGIVTFNSDMFGMFQVGAESQNAQNALARNIMDPAFQSAFNVVKGSVPARVDVPDTDFDACGKKAMAQLAEANENGTLVGAMGQGHAQPAALKQAYYDVVTAFVNGEYADEDEAVEELLNAIDVAR